MDNVISITVTPLQVLLGLAFQIWIIAFPIILIRKLNYLISLVSSQGDFEDQEGDAKSD